MVTLAFSSKLHCTNIQVYRDASMAAVWCHITSLALCILVLLSREINVIVMQKTKLGLCL